MNEETQLDEIQANPEPVEQTVQEVNDSLNAGFNKVRGDKPPAEAEPVKVGEATEVAEEIAPEPEPAKAMEPSEIEKLRAEVQAGLRQVHGKVGEINSRYLSLQSGGLNSEQRKVALAKFREDFPEVAETLEPLLGGAGYSSEDVSKVVQDELGKQAQGFNTKFEQMEARMQLTALHPDWQQVREQAEFKQWFHTKPEDEKQRLQSTWDAGAVSGLMTDFKKFRNDTQSQEAAKQRRLAGAVTPKGTPSGARQSRLPDSAGLMAGFNRVRRAA